VSIVASSYVSYCFAASQTMDTVFLSALVPEYYVHLERSATYHISSFAGSLQREGSQPRTNHLGIHAYLGMCSQERAS
jgi:hypothetical protein